MFINEKISQRLKKFLELNLKKISSLLTVPRITIFWISLLLMAMFSLLLIVSSKSLCYSPRFNYNRYNRHRIHIPDLLYFDAKISVFLIFFPVLFRPILLSFGTAISMIQTSLFFFSWKKIFLFIKISGLLCCTLWSVWIGKFQRFFMSSSSITCSGSYGFTWTHFSSVVVGC